VVLTPLRLEAWALSAALAGHGETVRVGYGLRRATAAAERLPRGADRPTAVAGFGGALAPGIAAGDVVVASEVRDGAGSAVPCPSASLVAGELRRAGLSVHVGPILTVDRVVRGAERGRLAASGALAVDMESYPLVRAAQAAGSPVVVIRAIVDTPDRPLARPVTAQASLAAWRSLRRAGRVLVRWAQVAGPRRVLLASPRSFCAGVERAIEIVERALELHGPPVYVRKQIVHNVHVVEDLRQRGAVFVDELDQVPAGATVVFSAHGVAPAVRDDAQRRGLSVIDASCPLVVKVHNEARRFARRGDTVLFIGHPGHEETVGTVGEAPDRMRLVSSVAQAREIEVSGPVSYLMQTTLAVDEATEIADALRERFPSLDGPSSEDICYATTNRQDALRAVAADADVVLVVGSQNSSNSKRLVEVAERSGTPAFLVDDATEIDLGWLRGATTVGLTAGASAPPALVQRVVDNLAGLGPVEVTERQVTEESVRFTLPKEVRGT
jgi:4-hydroxy-3-methylbut-2-enyl diphosphate reductase